MKKTLGLSKPFEKRLDCARNSRAQFVWLTLTLLLLFPNVTGQTEQNRNRIQNAPADQSARLWVYNEVGQPVSVYFDNSLRCSLPKGLICTIVEIAPGTHQLRLERIDGFSQTVSEVYEEGEFIKCNATVDSFIQLTGDPVFGRIQQLMAEKTSCAHIPDYKHALDEASRAIESDPHFAGANNNMRDAKAYFARGEARLRKGDLDRAIEDFSKGIEIEPGMPEAYGGRGVARQLNGDLDGAISDFGKAIAIDPRNSDIYITRGLAREIKSDFDGAIEDFGKAVEVNPRNRDAYYFRGSARHYRAFMLSRNDLAEAIADYSKSIEMEPNLIQPWTYYVRGIARSANRDAVGAIADLSKVLEDKPNYVGAYLWRADAQAAKNNWSEAIADYTKVINLKPDLWPVYFRRGLIYLRSDRGDAAYNDAQKALELYSKDKDVPPVMVLVGYLGIVKSDKAGATAFLESWVNRGDPSDWLTQVLHYLRREINEQQLLALATDKEKLTLAHAYLGLCLSLSGNRQAALPYLRWVRENGDKTLLEYSLANSELDRIE